MVETGKSKQKLGNTRWRLIFHFDQITREKLRVTYGFSGVIGLG